MRIAKDWKDDFALTTPRLVSQTHLSVTHFDAPLVKFVRTKLLICPIPLPETSMTHLPTKLVQKLINRSNTHGLLAVVACGAATLAITPAAALAQNDTATFWTHFAPSEDTRLVFVSSSSGRDTNSGLSPNKPVKSLARAYELLRDGHPDWMLLRRGDVWYESLPNWGKSGRSEHEKMIVGAFGDEDVRPQLRPAPSTIALHVLGSGTIEHVAFVGLHLEPQERQPSEGQIGIRWLQDSEDIHFEDLYVDGFKDNIVLQAYGEGVSLRDFKINGCVIVDAWSNSGHSQGIFASGVNGLSIEHCVIDNNGFNLDMGAEPTIFNHNVYVQNGCTDVSFRNNISSDASSHGIQLRPGGIIESNLFVSNPLAILLGGGSYPEEGGVSGIVHRNLVMYGRDISDDLPRAFGFTLSNIKDARVTNNYITISSVGANRDAISAGRDRNLPLMNLEISHNMILDWQGSIGIREPNGSEEYSNISVHSNSFYRDMSPNTNGNLNKPFIYLFDDHSESVQVHNNEYNHYSMHDRPFRVGTVHIDTADWLDMIEPSAQSIALESPPPAIGLEQYLADHEMSGDFQDFIDQARLLSRSNFDSRFTAAKVISWFELETQQHQITLVE